MKRIKNSLYFPLGIYMFICSCHKPQECIIKKVDQTILDKVGMYAIYASDTCWEQMVNFADSLTVVNKNISNDNIYIFVYPEPEGKVFISNSFALEKSYKSYKILEVQDTGLVTSPHSIIKYPDSYKKAIGVHRP